MLECNIDDMSGEIYSYLIEKLFENGARDVFYSSIYMKKNRPAIKISVLVDESNIYRVEKIIFKETSTFGIRKYKVERSILDRKFRVVNTSMGVFNLKFAYYENECLKVTPEYEECKLKAIEFNIPLKNVYNFINSFIENNIMVK